MPVSFRIRAALALCVLAILAESSPAAIINNANGRRTVKTTGKVTIKTTTSGQRQIAITIDPDITTGFRLDILYPEELAEPVNFGGFNTFLSGGAIQFIAPFVPTTSIGADAPTILPPAAHGGGGGLISNIEGMSSLPAPAFGPVAAAPPEDGGTDLFTLFFIDKDPTADKVFTVLGLDEKGIDPSLARFIEDNYIDILVDDPSDPLNGQIVRIDGNGIDRTDIFVPGIHIGGDPNPVPLPPAAWAGLAGAAGILLNRLRQSRRG
jgi:hypothetical protein